MGKYIRWRLLFYVVFFGFWSLWLLQERVDSFSRYIVDDCLKDIRGSRPAALVLGAGVKGNEEVSPVFADRLDTAKDLYKKGLVKKILVSGDHGQEYYDEVTAAKDRLVAQGVPEQDIFLDHAGFDTFDSIYRSKEVFGVDSMLLVTQDFHLRRSLFIANRLGLDAWGCRADKRYYLNSKYMEHREWFATVKAWLDVNLGSRPKYLGDPIDISGDGRITWD
ncbi:MAG: vancomycin high temperature exclusion protein [Bacillota bacterium]